MPAHRFMTRLVMPLGCLLLGACASPGPDAAPSRGEAIRFSGYGDHVRRVDTDDPEAQRLFDQGLALSYGFNHDEAIRSFAEAARRDGSCAMAWWGQAYALGPNINSPITPDRAERASVAIREAMARRHHATPLDRALIEALDKRYAEPAPADRGHLDLAYAHALARVWHDHPEDPDVGFLYADALMNLSPWDLWSPDFRPKHEVLEIVATLEDVLAIDANHLGANHLYIHAVEASATPQRGEAAADRLRFLAPGLGHLVHMPSHIYVQVGRFLDAMDSNHEGSRVDREYFELAGPQGEYHAYHAHNNHFGVWASMYQGRYADALAGCRRTISDMPEPMHGDPAAAEWLVLDVHVHLRFGRWQAALDVPRPRADQPYAVAMWHYGRGMAFANTGRIDEAAAEAASFEREAARVPRDQMIFIVPAHDVLLVAREMLKGETLYHDGRFEEAFEHLRAAVRHEDALRYSEPSPWMMPTRHALAALLLEQGKVEEAERLYREDLAKHPGNGWSLHGLAECLARGGRVNEAARVRRAFERAWRFATVPIHASCFCRRKG